MRDRLRRFPRWEDTTVQELLVWREEEQWATEEMARIHHKRQVLWPRTMTPESLYRLIFEPKVRTAYLSYPMQHAERGGLRDLERFKQRLEELLVVYDPADVNDFEVEARPATGRPDGGSLERPERRSDGSVELTRARSGGPNGADGVAATRAAQVDEAGSDAADAVVASTVVADAIVAGAAATGAVGVDSSLADRVSTPGPSPFTERELQHIADQIVWRDYKLIAQADMVIVFYDALVPSPGVISEMNYALQMGKRVYGVWLPENEPSPFFTRYCTRCFSSEDDLFRYFARYRITGARPLAGMTSARPGS